MKPRFSEALLSRERDRLALAAALNEQFTAERRGHYFWRIFFAAITIGFGIYVFRLGGERRISSFMETAQRIFSWRKLAQELRNPSVEQQRIALGDAKALREKKAATRPHEVNYRPGNAPEKFAQEMSAQATNTWPKAKGEYSLPKDGQAIKMPSERSGQRPLPSSYRPPSLGQRNKLKLVVTAPQPRAAEPEGRYIRVAAMPARYLRDK